MLSIVSTQFDTGTVSPILVNGWETGSRSRNRVHDLLYSPEPVVSLAPAASRSGTLKFLFATASDAAECYRMHRGAAVLTLTLEVGNTARTLRYVVDEGGEVRELLDPETASVTIIEVPYREVPL